MALRILIDARSVRTPSGRYVLHGLANAWLRDPRVAAVAVAVPPAFDATLIPSEAESIALADGSWLRHLAVNLRRLADRARVDVIFCPNGIGPADCRTVLYFQDMFHFRVRGATNVYRAWARRTLRAGWRRVAAPRCKLAVSVSEEIAAEVAQHVPLPGIMVPNGVDVGEVRWSGEDDSVFVLGGTGRRKDEGTAVRAWAMLPREVTSSTTLILGGVEPAVRRRELQRLAEALGVAERVVITGALTRAAYLEYMTRSRLAISCSRLEAFDLPVAEALAIGAPVLCSDIQAHRELLVRSGAGGTFEAGRAQSLAEQLTRSLRGCPPTRCQTPPVGWSWEARAREHVDAYVRHS